MLASDAGRRSREAFAMQILHPLHKRNLENREELLPFGSLLDAEQKRVKK
jgi:hypothetical protein